MKPLSAVFFRIGPVLMLALLEAGCAGYRIGTDALYHKEIKTVYVPMVEADTYRHGLGERLTEPICKKITERTPYQLGTEKNADSVLTVKLVAESQSVSALDKYNETRQKNLNWSVYAVWKDRKELELAELDPTPLTTMGINFSEQEYLVAEMGQSWATSSQELVDKIADRIVGMMEAGW